MFVPILLIFLLDFWELPKPHLTASLTDVVERDFYARCPPNKRPRHLRHNFSDSPKDVDDDESDMEKLGEGPNRKSANISPDGSTEETAKPLEQRKKRSFFTRSKDPKPTYDESLFKSLFRTFADRICLAGVLKLGGGMFGTLL